MVIISQGTRRPTAAFARKRHRDTPPEIHGAGPIACQHRAEPCWRRSEMVETIRYCPDCGWKWSFEQPHPLVGTCRDAPDGCCAEWFCTGCGAAMLIGFTSDPTDTAFARQPASRVA
jgi:hypothetical protein